MTAGKVLAVCLGAGGIPKAPVDAGTVGELGLEGDKHRFHLHGGPNRAMCLFSIEDYRSLQADGVVAPTTQELPSGQAMQSDCASLPSAPE